MNIRDEGLGHCQKCGTPIMQTINKPGAKGICFGCAADAEPKTGRTVVVTHEEGTGLDGKVTIQEVSNGAQSATHIAPVTKGTVTIQATLDELAKADALIVLLTKLNEGLDNMQFSTMKDAKLVMAIQAGIEKKLSKLKGD